MSADHPSVQQAFSVLKDHLEAIEKLQAQLKRWVGLHVLQVCDGVIYM